MAHVEDKAELVVPDDLDIIADVARKAHLLELVDN